MAIETDLDVIKLILQNRFGEVNEEIHERAITLDRELSVDGQKMRITSAIVEDTVLIAKTPDGNTAKLVFNVKGELIDIYGEY